MAKLKGSEEFVSESLKTYFEGKGHIVKYQEGGDPPDIYLEIDGKNIPVEITNIDENRINGRRTINTGYLKFIENLKSQFNKKIPSNKSVLIFFFHHYKKVSKLNKEFVKYLAHLFKSKTLDSCTIEDSIKGIHFKIIIYDTQKGKNQTISGAVTTYGGKRQSRNYNEVTRRIYDTNLDIKTSDIIKESIRDKNIKCKELDTPIYLALYDDFSNKYFDFENSEHIEHYKKAMDYTIIDDYKIFKKIFIIFDNKDVLEFSKDSL